MTHSIEGPPGYEPGALPLRHVASAGGDMNLLIEIDTPTLFLDSEIM